MRCLQRYEIILLLAVAGLAACQKKNVVLPSLEETYRNDDKNPFGGYVAFQKVNEVFDNIRTVKGNVHSIEQDKHIHSEADRHSLYFMITDRLYLPESDADWLTDYVRQGNDLFISANHISESFLRKIKVQTNQSIAYLDDKWGNMHETSVNIYFGKGLPELPFQFYYFPFNNYIRKYNKNQSTILGTNEHNQPNLITLFMGKGRLYLHLAPRSLSNYFLLTGRNSDYFYHILNYLRADPVVVYWDEYYGRIHAQSAKKKKDDDFSSLQVVMANPALKWAFLLAATGLFFFIFSNAKRKQRIVPLQEKSTNASVDFAETIGRLYFVNKNNKNIASKLVTYFYENVRSKYFLKPGADDGSFAIRLAGKKGIEAAQIRELLNCIRLTEDNEYVSDEQLLELNDQLEKFYNYRNNAGRNF